MKPVNFGARLHLDTRGLDEGSRERLVNGIIKPIVPSAYAIGAVPDHFERDGCGPRPFINCPKPGVALMTVYANNKDELVKAGQQSGLTFRVDDKNDTALANLATSVDQAVSRLLSGQE